MLLQEQILFFKSTPHKQGKSSLFRDASRMLQKLFPLVKMAMKHGSLPILLLSIIYYNIILYGNIIEILVI